MMMMNILILFDQKFQNNIYDLNFEARVLQIWIFRHSAESKQFNSMTIVV